MHNVNVYLITMNVNKKIQKYKRTKANKSQWGPRTDRKNAHARRYTFLSNFVKKNPVRFANVLPHNRYSISLKENLFLHVGIFRLTFLV